MKIYIRAMSENKSRLHDQLVPLAGKMIEHLMKCFMFPNTDPYEHWKGEIYSFIHDVPKLSNSKKWPDSDFLVKCLWDTYEDAIEDWYPQLIDEYSSYHLNTHSESVTVYNCCSEYVEWLCVELSRYGRVSSRSCFEKIDNIVEGIVSDTNEQQ